MKLFYFDTETTGTEFWRHSIHQISGVIEIDGQITDKFDFRVQPNPKAKIETETLDVAGVTLDQVMAYPEMKTIYRELIKLLGKYVDKFKKTDKFFMVGYNSQAFDSPFLRAWFKQNGDEYFGSWFWSHTIDVMILATHQLMADRHKMVDFKLMTVAKQLGIAVDETRLHDALYDIWLTRECLKILNGLKPIKIHQTSLISEPHDA